MTHFTNLMVGHTLLFLLYLALFRAAVVPRVIPVAGMIAGIVGFADVAQPLVGRHFSFYLVLPAGVCLLALIVWLLAKGLADQPS
jgi:hypothetical protein